MAIVRETMTNAEVLAEAMKKLAITDARPPAEVCKSCEATGLTKAKRDTLSTIVLGILAGVFIGLGAMFFTLVTTHSGLGFGLSRLLGGVVFCLGLILVVVAGAELFTGNTLMSVSWMSGKVSVGGVLRNWGLVYAANLAGSLSLVALMFYSRQWTFDNYSLGANALSIATAKVNLSFGSALARGILCNALVCLAIWLCFSARTVTDKILAIAFPITAFVAAGFEHSIANMYFIPMGLLASHQPAVVQAAGVAPGALANLTWGGFFLKNLIPVTIGNIIGGSILVGAAYWVAYLRAELAPQLVARIPWIQVFAPAPARARPQEIPRGGRMLVDVLTRAKDDADFQARLAENPQKALEGYSLSAEERAALASGDVRWIEARVGSLDESIKTWLTARLAQEKW